MRIQSLSFLLALSLPFASFGAIGSQGIAAQVAAVGEAPPFDASATMRAVAQLVEYGHISERELDDDISERAFDSLFESLDPYGLYFTVGDVAGFADDRDRLDDHLREGDERFAMALHRLWVKRIGDGVARALHWIDADLDFTVEETFLFDADEVGFAKDADDLDDRWRRRIKYDVLRMEYDGVDAQEARERLRKRYSRVAERVERSRPRDTVGRVIRAITESYDPHTEYLLPRDAENFQIHMRLNYEGIGAILSDQDGRVVITKVFPKGAAGKSGEIENGDVILGVAQGEDGEIEAIDGELLDDVVARIRGPGGTKVRLQIAAKEEGGEPRIVVLERQRTELEEEAATGEVKEIDGKKVGWLELPSFYGSSEGRTATKDVERILHSFKAQKVDSVVLDLRSNGGGYLDEAVSLAGLFIDTGNVVQVRSSSGRVQKLDDEDPGIVWNGPLVVLTSRFSASASEIVAGALQDLGRALVVGDTTTHGKGTVQSVLDVDRARLRGKANPTGMLKLTIQQFFRPLGDSTQLRGVESDIVLPSWSEVIAKGEAELPNALPFKAIEPAEPARNSKFRDRSLLARLGEESKERVAGQQFDVVRERVARAEFVQGRTEVPLEREAFKAFVEAGKSAEEALAQDEDEAEEPDDYEQAYRGEVMKIAGHYAKLLADKG